MADYTLIPMSAAVAVATVPIMTVGNSASLLPNDLASLPVTLHFSKADYILTSVSAAVAVAVATAPITTVGNSALYYGMI
jgi:hypothetical protein